MSGGAELELYVAELRRLLGLLSEAIGGLDEARLNWRPDEPDTNSAYVIAEHTMGNLEAWVLGIVCGQRVDRDRPAEFASSGADAAPLVAKAEELAARFADALAALPDGAPDEMRQPAQSHWGIGSPHPVTVRQALMVTIEHAAIHLGQLNVTLDMARAAVRS